MCRRRTLSCCSCTSGSAIPQPMPLPQVPVGVCYLSNVCLLSSGVPENARGVLGCLTNDIRVFPAFYTLHLTLYTLHFTLYTLHSTLYQLRVHNGFVCYLHPFTLYFMLKCESVKVFAKIFAYLHYLLYLCTRLFYVYK